MMIDVSRRGLKQKVYWKIARLVVKVMEVFIQCHLVNSRRVYDNLVVFGVKKPIEHILTPLNYSVPIKKQDHPGFNVLYYFPLWSKDGFTKWLYGYDIFLNIQKNIGLPDINFIVVSGDSDMKDVYPITDFYLRCNRHDGNSRMVRECDVQDIPYYWTDKDPSEIDATQAIIQAYNDRKQ